MVMAGMLPLMVLGLFLVMCTVIGFVFVAFANERRYLRIIEALNHEGHEEKPKSI